MKVYILDQKNKNLTQMLMWLEKDKRTYIEVFEDYLKFVNQVGYSQPDFCIIRLGWNGIPGLKTAEMVRQISHDIHIIFVSDDQDYAVDAYEIGAYGYLLCPVKKDKLENYLIMNKEM